MIFFLILFLSFSLLFFFSFSDSNWRSYNKSKEEENGPIIWELWDWPWGAWQNSSTYHWILYKGCYFGNEHLSCFFIPIAERFSAFSKTHCESNSVYNKISSDVIVALNYVLRVVMTIAVMTMNRSNDCTWSELFILKKVLLQLSLSYIYIYIKYIGLHVRKKITWSM